MQPSTSYLRPRLRLVVLLRQTLLLQERINFRWLIDPRFWLLRLRIQRQRCKFDCQRYVCQRNDKKLPRESQEMAERTLLASERRAVHRLAHNPQDETDGIFDRDVLLVLLLQKRLGRAVVRTDTCRLPPRVVP